MARRKFRRRTPYPRPEELRDLTIPQMALELGIPLSRVRYVLRNTRWWLQIYPDKGTGRYSAEDFELLKGLLGVPHRELDHKHDWLTKYEGGSDEHRGVRPVGRTDRKGTT